MEVGKLPAVVITKILAELDWIDKLNAINGILPWQIYLETPSSWPQLVYGRVNNESEDLGKLPERTQMNLLLYCIEKYGAYLKNVSLEIIQCVTEWNYWEFQLFEAVLRYCTNLRHFKVFQISTAPWSPIITKTYLEILKKKYLTEAELVNPVVPWNKMDCNPLLGIINNKLQHKVTVLKLQSDSLEDFNGHLSCLVTFKNLRELSINRNCINNEIILQLTSHSLTALGLYQDEDIPDNHSDSWKEEFWKKIVNNSPRFRIDLIMECVIILKDHFAPFMPLRKLVLDELQTNITKGLLDEIILKYNTTLQSFACVNSNLSESADGRLELALIDMVKQCHCLQELEYEFSISSATILLIAKVRKLKKLRFLRVEVYYDFDNKNLKDCTESESKWIKEHSRNEEMLERTVSDLFGCKWELDEKSDWFSSETNWF